MDAIQNLGSSGLPYRQIRSSQPPIDIDQLKSLIDSVKHTDQARQQREVDITNILMVFRQVDQDNPRNSIIDAQLVQKINLIVLDLMALVKQPIVSRELKKELVHVLGDLLEPEANQKIEYFLANHVSGHELPHVFDVFSRSTKLHPYLAKPNMMAQLNTWLQSKSEWDPDLSIIVKALIIMVNHGKNDVVMPLSSSDLESLVDKLKKEFLDNKDNHLKAFQYLETYSRPDVPLYYPPEMKQRLLDLHFLAKVIDAFIRQDSLTKPSDFKVTIQGKLQEITGSLPEGVSSPLRDGIQILSPS